MAEPSPARAGGFTHVARVALDYAPDLDLAWTGKSMERGIFVFVWMVAGKPVHVTGVAETNSSSPASERAR
jgi:hypothetical protein